MVPVRTIICLIVALLGFAPATTIAAERVYFIAADEVTWDYAHACFSFPPLARASLS